MIVIHPEHVKQETDLHRLFEGVEKCCIGAQHVAIPTADLLMGQVVVVLEFIRFLFSTIVTLVLLIALGVMGTAAFGRRCPPPSAPLHTRDGIRFVLTTGHLKAGVGIVPFFSLPTIGFSSGTTQAAVFLYESLAPLAFAHSVRSQACRSSSPIMTGGPHDTPHDKPDPRRYRRIRESQYRSSMGCKPRVPHRGTRDPYYSLERPPTSFMDGCGDPAVHPNTDMEELANTTLH
jgi:hypothetical protein